MKKFSIRLSLVLIATGVFYFFISCASTPAPLPTPSNVDLDRFMGTWYVIGYTPLGVDETAHNAIEHYFLADGGKIETTYQFRKGGFDGEVKTLTPVGRVYNTESNAEWRMQFVWPFEAEYIILDLSSDYQRTIVAHPNRKYAWIMARTPEISSFDYSSMMETLESEGFDRSLIRKVPHDWSNEQDRLRAIREAGKTKRVTVNPSESE